MNMIMHVNEFSLFTKPKIQLKIFFVKNQNKKINQKSVNI